MIVVSGATVSIVQALAAGVWSTLPARSTARTAKLCEPFCRPLWVLGDEHATKATPSSEHWKLAASLAPKVKLAQLALVNGGGPERRKVSAGALSIVTDAATVASFPELSTAMATTVAAPSAMEAVSQLSW